MIPTRTELLQLRERVASVSNSVAILQSRRQALVREFIASVQPFLRSRVAIRDDYRRALIELHLSTGHEGDATIDAITTAARREIGVEVAEKNVMGVRYKEPIVIGTWTRAAAGRGYGYGATTPHLEQAIDDFERLGEQMLAIAAFENRLMRLGDEIRKVTRRTRVLEEQLLPRLRSEIRAIAQYLGEREREAHFRLKRFKSSGGALAPPDDRSRRRTVDRNAD